MRELWPRLDYDVDPKEGAIIIDDDDTVLHALGHQVGDRKVAADELALHRLLSEEGYFVSSVSPDDVASLPIELADGRKVVVHVLARDIDIFTSLNEGASY